MKRNLSAGLTLSGVSAIVVATVALATPAAAGTMAVGVNSMLDVSLSGDYVGDYSVIKIHYRRGRRARRHNRYSRRSYRRGYRNDRYYGGGYSLGYPRKSYRRSYRSNRYYGGRSYGNYGRSCHATSKTGYWYGRKAKIGGTMCYDSYGGSYIVPGSRYLIHYYGY